MTDDGLEITFTYGVFKVIFSLASIALFNIQCQDMKLGLH